MQLLLVTFLFFLGAIFGSFFGVILDRYNTGKGIGGRSMCFTCKRTLKAPELVPIVSWVCLGGKCRGCKTKISIEYLFLEIASGLVFVASALIVFPMYGYVGPVHFFAFMAYYLSIFSIFLIIAFYDLRHTIIPDPMVYTAAAIAFFGIFLFPNPTIWDILAGPILASPFALIWFFSKGKYMGLGDAKLALPIGWMLGLSGGVAALLFAFWIGAVISLVLMAVRRGRYQMKTEIPFAPYLVIGAYIAFALSLSIEGMMMWMY
jgi:prepilin signal peptidase PulO-like enzyme (type II secretory pathway)